MGTETMMEGHIIAVCISRKKHEKKRPVDAVILETNLGINGDAHAEIASHRQVSMLNSESIEKMRYLGINANPGDFAENLVINGLALDTFRIGAHLITSSGVLLEVSQIGKECHNRCVIYEKTGNCIMPVEGIFAKVNRGGVIKPGDKITLVE
jgi:MOSC domain-containing protein YiiM